MTWLILRITNNKFSLYNKFLWMHRTPPRQPTITGTLDLFNLFDKINGSTQMLNILKCIAPNGIRQASWWISVPNIKILKNKRGRPTEKMVFYHQSSSTYVWLLYRTHSRTFQWCEMSMIVLSTHRAYTCIDYIIRITGYLVTIVDFTMS